MNIVAARLHNHHLADNPLAEVQGIVKHLSAVQSQDYSGAAWALSLRLRGVTKTDIDQAYNDGVILRTHVLRPTWHFVLPEDIKWMVKLTAPRISQTMAYYNRKLELNADFFARSHNVIAKALERDRFLTRAEIGDELARHGIEAQGQRLGHIVMQAEIDGLICSGPLRGKQFTYALVTDRAPNAKELDRDESLALLALRYFTSHGPATIRDFAWWSGLTMSDAKAALQLVADKLQRESFNNNEYWFAHMPATDTIKMPEMLLLSVYDEYIIAYEDYSPIFPAATKHLTNIFGNARLDYVIIRRGLAAGSWRRTLKPKEIMLEMNLDVPLSAKDKAALKHEADQYAQFLNTSLKDVEIKSR